MCGGRDECAAGEMVCFSEESSGALVYCGDGVVLEGVLVDAGDFKMVSQVLFHFESVDTL